MKRTLLMVMAAGLALSVLPAFAVAQPGAGKQGEVAAAPSEMLPIRRITLYRSGVGAFQREGLVEGSNQVQLKFDVSQINDILKSLQLLDLDGGRIDSVGYASRDPLARRLNSFSVPIADNPSLQMLLSRLRGAAVTLSAAEGTVSGTILGVEMRKVPGGKDTAAIDAPFVSLVTSTGIRSLNINGISNFQLNDKALADELARALAAVADSRADRVKTVDLALSGNGARRVAVRYVHETPVWKTSYRLVLGDAPESKKDAGGTPVPDTLALQGWAIVENTTDTDWRDVKLSLVSGRPVSFQMDLAEPLYMGRPDIAVPTIPGVMPKSYDGGVKLADNKAGAPRPMAPASAPPGGAAQGGGERGLARMRGAVSADMMAAKEMAAPDAAGTNSFFGLTTSDLTDYAPQAQAKAGAVGEIFFYEVSNPITVERQRSAMIPFLSTNISGRRVSIFNQSDRADHPMRGVELTNTSDMQLLPGPLAVFDGIAYAGDATVNQVSPGDKRLLAYAVDLDVAVSTKPQGGGTVTNVKIVNGAFEQTVKQIDGLTYTFANKD
ncbi:MAG: hypothetical protein ACT4PL_05125 [Phycisphaerales bacterium]